MTDKLPLGCKLLITTGNGSTFTGSLHSFDESVGKVVLKKVTTEGSRLCGLQNFYYSDMAKLQVINEPPRAKRTSFPDKNNGTNLMSIDPKMSIPHDVVKAETINRDKSVVANINGTENGKTSHGYENGKTSHGYENGESRLVHEDDENCLVNVNGEYYEKDYYTLIYKWGDKFYEAIAYIMGQEAVGVTFEGVSIGRNGTLSVIQISTETDVIAFDMLQLGKAAFVEGLQAMFESDNIIKVIHDCRWISDMLQEEYKIRVANVFDTQVANAYVYRILHNGNWPRYVESLPSCLVKHLKLLPEDVTFSKVKEGVQEKSGQSPWLQRPLPKQLLTAAQKNASYLTQLHKVLLNKMMYEFRMGVEIYLSHVRNMDGEIESCQKHGYFLPPIFWKIPKLVHLTYGDSQGQSGAKSDMKGQDLPAPERCFLSHNLVKPKPKDPVVCERYSKPEEKTVIKYDNEGNPNIIFGQTINRNFSLTGTAAAYGSNGTVENGSTKLHGETQQDNNLNTQEEIACGNHQDLSFPFSWQRSDFCSKTVNQEECNKKVEEFNGSLSDLINKRNENNNASRHEQGQLKVVFPKKSEAEVGECHGNKNNLAFSVMGMTGGSNKQNISAQEPDQLMASSEKCRPTHTNVMSEQKDNVLPIENTNPTSEHPSSDASFSIQRSKLWQMFYANQARRTTELPRYTADLDSLLDVEEVLMKTGTEQDILAKTDAESDTDSRRAMPKLIRVHHDTELDSRHSLSDSADCADTPGKPQPVEQPRTSRLSGSFHNQSPSSYPETSLAHHSSAELNTSKGKYLDCFSFLPAGFGQVGGKKNRATDQKQSHKSDNKYESDNSDFLSISLEEDLCYIPMQGSLKCRQELPLGETSFDFGDSFSDSDCNLQLPGSSQSFMELNQSFNAKSSDEDESMCRFENSELFQKVLRMASSLPLENLKSKLLPSKVSLYGK